MSSNETEVYVLANTRDPQLARNFLDKFLPERKELAADYPFPQFVNEPSHVFTEVNKLLDRLMDSPEETYSMYWSNLVKSKISNAMLFYTNDGSIVLGTACHESDAQSLMLELAKFAKASFGLISLLDTPPESAKDFELLCRNATVTSMVGGKIQSNNYPQ